MVIKTEVEINPKNGERCGSCDFNSGKFCELFKKETEISEDREDELRLLKCKEAQVC